MKLSRYLLLGALLALPLFAAACGGDDDSPTPTATAAANTTAGPTSEPLSGRLIVYSGRSEDLIGPLLEKFQAETGVDVRVRYGSTPAMAAAILEEGSRSPADVYIGQDAGSVGQLSLAGVFAPLPEDVLSMVPAQFSSASGDWVGISGRVRVVVYNKAKHTPESLPDSIFDYTDPAWRGKIGWAPTNASFQSFVTAMRVIHGEAQTKAWLEGIVANNPMVYSGNGQVLQAVASGEVEVGFINHYYLGPRLAETGGNFGAANYYFTNGDVGGLMNVAGVGVLKTAPNQAAANALIKFLLSAESQEYFATQTYEYPLLPGIPPPAEYIPPLDTLNVIEVDLSKLGDVEATVALLQQTGALP
ncbi:MAG TPA: iron ABC transporter substrate-binding protein [Tepidiformaceae bacterium]|nr:iron ABC transporter substrate-binding protein [Tepidiformaceae bacterium]